MTRLEDLEEKALRQFRPLAVNLCLHEEDMHDANLLKWLRARNLNPREAAEMLRKAVDWRKLHRMDRILAWEAPDEFKRDFPYDMDGEDKHGYPVFTIPFGKWDIRRAYDRGQKDLVIRYMTQLLERVIEKCRLKNLTDPGNVYINQVFFIWDMEGMSMRQLASTGLVDACLEFCKNIENIYPELLKGSIVVNAPKVYAILYAMVKPILTQRTQDKVQIYGFNSEKWKAVLRNYIDEDQLLEHYGGTRIVEKDFDIIRARTISISEFIRRQYPFVRVTVEARDKVEVALDVIYPNSILKWQFYTSDFDIKFYLLFQDKNLMLFNTGRIDSHLEKQEGSYTAVIPGRYLLVFDNTYSCFRSKTLFYNVTETHPEGVDDKFTTLGVMIEN